MLCWSACRLGGHNQSARNIRTAAAFGIVGRVLLFDVETSVGEAALLVTETTTGLLGWTILGAMLGAGSSPYIPNLDRRHAVAAGTVSGAASGVSYLTLSSCLNGFSARIIGALASGFSPGLLNVVAEIACRNHWLDVTDSTGDRRTINLGRRAVSVQNQSKEFPVRESFNDTSTVIYRVENDSIVCEDRSNGLVRRVALGEHRSVGGAQFTVRSRRA